MGGKKMMQVGMADLSADFSWRHPAATSQNHMSCGTGTLSLGRIGSR